MLQLSELRAYSSPLGNRELGFYEGFASRVFFNGVDNVNPVVDRVCSDDLRVVDCAVLEKYFALVRNLAERVGSSPWYLH